MNLITPILNRHLLRQQHHRALARAIRARARFQTHESQHRRRVDDPAPVARGVRGLSQELLDCEFAAEEDGAGVDFPF